MHSTSRKYRFTIEHMDEVYSVARLLSAYFPEPDKFITAIYELLANAIEHGNLDLGLNEKTDLLRQGKWRDEIARRQSLPENAGKKVSIELAYDTKNCKLVIPDQGQGFEWKEFMNHKPNLKRNDTRPNGRGLNIVQDAPFDSVDFNNKGNAITCTAHYDNTGS